MCLLLRLCGTRVKPDILYICTHSRGVVPEKTNWKKLEIFSNMFKISYKSVVLNKLKKNQPFHPTLIYLHIQYFPGALQKWSFLRIREIYLLLYICNDCG